MIYPIPKKFVLWDKCTEGSKDENGTFSKEKSKDRRGHGLTGTEVNEGGYWDGPPSLVPGGQKC